MPRRKLTPLQRLFRLLRKDAQEIKNIYVYSFFSGLVTLSLPLGLEAIVNLVQGGWITISWIVLIFFVLAGVIITGIIYIAQMRIIENLQQKVYARTAMEFAYRFPKIQADVFYRHYPPDLANRFFDAMTIQKALPKLLIDVSFALFSIFFGLVLLSLYHPFFMVYFLIVLLLFWVLRQMYYQGIKTSLKTSSYKYRTAAWLEEIAHAYMALKLAGETDLPLEKTDKLIGLYTNAREQRFKVLVWQSIIIILFKILIVAGLLIIGGLLVMEQQMNIGQFVASEVVVLLIMGNAEKLLFSLESIYAILTALEKIGFVTDLPLEPENRRTLRLNGKQLKQGLSVEVKDIHFTYPGMSMPALQGVSFSVEPGEKVMITGSERSGKTTLLRIIAGLFYEFEGNILYNGQSVRSLEIKEIRSITGDFMVKDIPFEGTILENITMNREGITLEDVEWAVENVGLKEFIRSLPDGYYTRLFPQEQRLSESAILKIMIARSIVHKPKLLVLDNPLEHLPPESFRKIIDFLMAKERPWTLICASYNAYLARKADKIIILDKGTVIAQGTYKELESILDDYIH